MNNGFGIVQKIRIEGVLCVAGEGGKRPVAGQAGVELGLGPLGLARKLLALAGTEWESLGQLAGRESGRGLVAILGAIGLCPPRTYIVHY